MRITVLGKCAALWAEFIIGFIVFGLFLTIPGFLISRSLRLSFFESMCYSACVSIPLYVLLSILYSKLNIFSSWEIYFLPLTFIGIVCLAMQLLHDKKEDRISRIHDALSFDNWIARLKKGRTWIPLLYFVVSIFYIGVVVVKNYDGAASFSISYDNYFHYSVPSVFIDTGDWSTFHTSLYSINEDFLPPIQPAGLFSYYPAGWHMLVALIASTSSMPITLSANIVSTFISSITFASGMLLFLKAIFKNDRTKLVLGSVASFSFAGFPYLAFCTGLVGNYCSICFLPFILASFIKAFETLLDTKRISGKMVFTLILCIATAGIMQPSTVIAAVIALTLFCIFRLANYRLLNLQKRIVAIIGFAVFLILFLVALFHTTQIQSMIPYIQKPSSTLQQAIIDIICFSTSGLAQVFVGAFVLLGLVSALAQRQHLWIVATFLFFSIVYIAVATLDADSWIKQFLSCFWYGNLFRISWIITIFAIPFLAMGLSTLSNFMNQACCDGTAIQQKKTLNIITALLILATMSAPLFSNIHLEGIGDYVTPFGRAESNIESSFKQANEEGSKTFAFTTQEREFVQKAKALIEPDAVVVNIPDDGSFLAFPIEGLKTYYRTFGGNLHKDAWLIASYLNQYASNEDVRTAVNDASIKYVLQLDCNRYGVVDGNSLSATKWVGIYGIDENTEGFELILEDGDMKLYKIIDS